MITIFFLFLVALVVKCHNAVDRQLLPMMVNGMCVYIVYKLHHTFLLNTCLAIHTLFTGMLNIHCNGLENLSYQFSKVQTYMHTVWNFAGGAMLKGFSNLPKFYCIKFFHLEDWWSNLSNFYLPKFQNFAPYTV